MRRLFILVLPVLFAACSSGQSVPVASTNTHPQVSSPAAASSYVAVVGEKELIAVATPVPPYVGPAPATEQSSLRSSASRPFATVSQYDHAGQAGVLIDPGAASGNGGVYVSMTAYDGLQLNAARDTSAANALYAPTTHGPNGDCFELTTTYWRGHGDADTSRYVRLFNFCDKGGTWEDAYDKPINADFVRKYVRVFAGGSPYPEYTTEQIQETDGRWHVLLYNYAAQAWEDWGYSFAGQTSVLNAQGWSIFETHYTPGPCSNIPAVGVDGLRVLTSSGWQLVDSSLGANNTAPLDCFSNSTSTYYSATTTTDFNQWVVNAVTQ